MICAAMSCVPFMWCFLVHVVRSYFAGPGPCRTPISSSLQCVLEGLCLWLCAWSLLCNFLIASHIYVFTKIIGESALQENASLRTGRGGLPPCSKAFQHFDLKARCHFVSHITPLFNTEHLHTHLKSRSRRDLPHPLLAKAQLGWHEHTPLPQHTRQTQSALSINKHWAPQPHEIYWRGARTPAAAAQVQVLKQQNAS